MRHHGMGLRWLLSVALLIYLVVGCDVEYLGFEDSADYRAFDSGATAPANPAEVNRALEIIATGEPLNDLSWAYSIILASVQVTVDPDDISNATFTVQEVQDIMDEVRQWRCLPQHEFVEQLLRLALKRANEPGFNPQEPPRNTTLAAVANSLKSDSLGRASIAGQDQIDDNTLLTHGDILLILVSIYHSSDPELWQNELAVAIDQIFHSGYYLSLDQNDVSESKLFRDRKHSWRILNLDDEVDNDIWHFLAVTLGRKKLRIYVDDSMKEITSDRDFLISPNDVPIKIGTGLTDDGWQQFLGMVDEVAIFNRDLAQDEIQSIYQNGIEDFLDGIEPALGIDSLVLYLPFDEIMPVSIVPDESNHENPCAIIGGALMRDGKIGKCMQFVQDSYIEVPDIPAYDIEDAISLMAWVKTSTVIWPATKIIDKTLWQDPCIADLSSFTEEIIDTPVSAPHQGELIVP